MPDFDAVNCPDDDHSVPRSSRADALTLVTAPGGNPAMDTATVESSSPTSCRAVITGCWDVDGDGWCSVELAVHPAAPSASAARRTPAQALAQHVRHITIMPRPGQATHFDPESALPRAVIGYVR